MQAGLCPRDPQGISIGRSPNEPGKAIFRPDSEAAGSPEKRLNIAPWGKSKGVAMDKPTQPPPARCRNPLVFRAISSGYGIAGRVPLLRVRHHVQTILSRSAKVTTDVRRGHSMLRRGNTGAEFVVGDGTGVAFSASP